MAGWRCRTNGRTGRGASLAARVGAGDDRCLIFPSAAPLVLAAALRAGLTSALRTPASRCTARCGRRQERSAARIAKLLEDAGVAPSLDQRGAVGSPCSAAVAPAAWLVTRRVAGSGAGGVLPPCVIFWLVGDYLARGFGRSRPASWPIALAPLLAPTARAGGPPTNSWPTTTANPETPSGDCLREEEERRRSEN